MTQTIYGLISDGGDGSASMRWFREEPDLEMLEDKWPESYGLNEGQLTVLNFPDDLDLEKAGFSFDELMDEYQDTDDW